MARKTIEVETVRELVNRFIAKSAEGGLSEDGRQILATLIEAVLMQTGNYHGFRYLDGWEAVQAGEYDESARHYH